MFEEVQCALSLHPHHTTANRRLALLLQQFYMPRLLFTPTKVHAPQHFQPCTRLSTAFACVPLYKARLRRYIAMTSMVKADPGGPCGVLVGGTPAHMSMNESSCQAPKKTMIRHKRVYCNDTPACNAAAYSSGNQMYINTPANAKLGPNAN